jgi:ketosteroid isomerase-like protein
VADTAVVRELLEAIRARDVDRIAACFAPDARLRALTPHELRELDGPDAIADRYRRWLEPLESLAGVAGDVEPIGQRVRLP